MAQQYLKSIDNKHTVNFGFGNYAQHNFKKQLTI